MKVRTAGLLDLARIEEMHRSSDIRLSEAAPPAARLWTLLSSTLSALLPLSQETLMYVAEENGKVVGFIQASGQPIGLDLRRARVLQVLNLQVADEADPDDVAPALVQHLCNQALERGSLRLFVRLPDRDPLLPAFRTQGFRQYATEQVVYAEKPSQRSNQYPDGLRAVKRGDDRKLYQLYRKVTPQGVSQLEAPTYREWRALHSGELAGGHVVDRIEIVGWVRMQRGSGARPDTLQFMALPENTLPAELADFGISLLRESESPAWSSLRHYDSHMIDALRGRGFTVLLTQLLLVKELAVRVPKPVREKGLVPSFG
ncbi:MAG: GNAT family N-acetyltransferase [Chloroflexi bacterium]|nr:MAG: GNAT family N-acetyltransferase [Chloroflexota bacterium]TMG04687.1 MAG: GNAT family N-acetyltransferase [Chloroflexota bacterium]TMG20927.1 MAG: GNAT family N-acetyltransferase [Chloroflexota bacterium]TMG67593.1 MAG: GNAT family N-acetyltransferase [Chloroflexota bacterium]